jgi:predicted Zn-dependent protease
MQIDQDGRTDLGGEAKRGAGFYRRPILAAFLGALALAFLPACVTTPVTGRKTINALSIEDDKQMGAQAYAETLKTLKLKDSGPEFALVQRVVNRLVPITDDPGFDWEVHLVDDPKTVNAWCMPGGKMAVYTGILPVTGDETGLAVVLGHEISHAIARHGTERVTSQLGLEIVLEFIGGKHKELAGDVANLAVFMPWGRKQELEADHIGLIYMARAGYDPRRAEEFWTRMAAMSKGNAPPEILSTHPSDEERIKQIHKLMPEALQVWQKSGAAPQP